MKVEIHSVFGAELSAICAGGKIIRIEETEAKTGIVKDTGPRRPGAVPRLHAGIGSL